MHAASIGKSVLKIGKKFEDRFQKKLAAWKGKHLSYGGTLVLISSCLTMFMLYFFEILRGFLEKMDYYYR